MEMEMSPGKTIGVLILIYHKPLSVMDCCSNQ